VTSVVVELLDAAGMRAIRDEVLALYQQVHADRLHDPFSTPVRFWERLGAYASRTGFSMITGRLDGELVGFALGYPLPPGSRWWTHLRGPHQDDTDFLREDGRRTFAVNELMVHPAWRGHGIGRALHNELLAHRAEERATLLVRSQNEPAHSAYLRWGWEVIGTIQPFPDSPVFDALIRRPARVARP
jgi:GNAT superfamily N-acetyltransferase